VDFTTPRNSKQVDFAMLTTLSLQFYIYYGMSLEITDIDIIREYYTLILIYTTATAYKKLSSQQIESSHYPSINTTQNISSLERGITMKSALAPENIIVSMYPYAMASTIPHMYISSKRSWNPSSWPIDLQVSSFNAAQTVLAVID
jgi:hypothetical protein